MTVEDLKTHLKNSGQVLKTRDDHAPVFLNRNADSTAADQFILPDDSQCSWAKPGKAFGAEKLRPRIEPWLTALVQSEHLSLLVGSGLTHAVHRLGTGAVNHGSMRGRSFSAPNASPGFAQAQFESSDKVT